MLKAPNRGKSYRTGTGAPDQNMSKVVWLKPAAIKVQVSTPTPDEGLELLKVFSEIKTRKARKLLLRFARRLAVWSSTS